MGILLKFRPRQTDPWDAFLKIVNDPVTFDVIGMVDLSHSPERKHDESVTGADLLFKTSASHAELEELCEQRKQLSVVWEFSLERMDLKKSAGRIHSLTVGKQGLLVRLHFVRDFDLHLPSKIKAEHLPRSFLARVVGAQDRICLSLANSFC